MRAPLIVACVALTLWALALAPAGHYSADAGVKLTQAHDLWLSGMTSRALRPSPVADPEDAYRRVGLGFERQVEGHWQGTYSVVFAGAAAPLVAAFGLRGGYLVALAGGLMCVLGVWLALRRAGARTGTVWAACLTTALATPVLFYSGQLFEHTVAAGGCALALALVMPTRAGAPGRDRPLAAGALLAVAAMVRPEAYCAVAAAGLAIVALPGTPRQRARRAVLYLTGVLVLLGAYWTFNHVTAGAWDPLVDANGKQTSLRNALTMLWGELRKKFNPSFLVPLVLAIGVGLVPERARTGWRRAALHGVVALAITVAAFNAFRGANSRIVTGLFTVTPLAAYGFVAGPWRAETRAHWVFALVFVALVLFFERGGNAGGLQLGARMLLPALPVLLVLAALVVEADAADAGAPRGARRVTAGAAAVLLGLGVVTDVRGTVQAVAIARAGERAAALAADAPGRLMVTKLEWHAGVLSPALLAGKDVIISRDGHDRRLFALLAVSEVEAFVYTARDPVKELVHTAAGDVVFETVASWTLAKELKSLPLQVVRITRPVASPPR